MQPEPDSEEEDKPKKLKAEEDFYKGFSGSEGLHHENMGCRIISNNQDIFWAVRNNFVLLTTDGNQILNPKFAVWKYGEEPRTTVNDDDVDLITKKLLCAVGEMVRGNYENKIDQEYPWLEKYSAMIQIIHSDLDADNFDYLMRDATFSGTSYGIMDMGVLLNCLVVSKFENEFQGKSKYIIGVQKKGIGCVEQFLLNKFLAYSQMILTKYVSILEAMLFRLESGYLIPMDKDYTCEKIEELVDSSQSELKYLAFTDHYIHERIFTAEGMKTALAALPRAIVTHLANSSALNLIGEPENECICTGFDTNTIIKEVTESPVYKRFLEVYNKIKDVKGSDVKPDLEKELFSFRFEVYSLTKQIPIEDFQDQFLFSDMEQDRRYNFYYYRFGNGIPVIEKNKSYSYKEDADGKASTGSLPLLCVDTPQSALKGLCSMKYVSLRQYNVCDYSCTT